MSKSRKVLVTGGAGYIGAHTVVELDAAGYEPVIVDNLSRSDRTLLDGIAALTGKQIPFYQGDCCDAEFLARVFDEVSFGGVLHFAAFKSVSESVAIPLAYYRNNVGSMYTLLQAMQNHGIRDFIFSSSCTVYGQPDVIPVTEKAPFKRAESPYGATKQVCERMIEDVFPTGFRVISLRYFNPVGAHPSALLGELPIGRPNNLVPFVTQTAAGVREKVTVFGSDYDTPDGTCLRDFIHVVDLAKAHVRALDYLARQSSDSFYDVFNVGTGEGVSVLELIKTFVNTTGVQVPYVMGDRRPGDVEKVYADPTKVNNVLPWRAEYSLADSLRHAWQWERKIRNLKD